MICQWRTEKTVECLEFDINCLSKHSRMYPYMHELSHSRIHTHTHTLSQFIRNEHVVDICVRKQKQSVSWTMLISFVHTAQAQYKTKSPVDWVSSLYLFHLVSSESAKWNTNYIKYINSIRRILQINYCDFIIN